MIVVVNRQAEQSSTIFQLLTFCRAYTPRKRLQCNPWTPGWLVPYSWFRRRRSFKYDSLNRITWYDDFTCLYCELSANEYLSCLSLSWPYWPHSWELKYAILWYSIPMPSCAYATLASGKAITLCSNIHKRPNGPICWMMPVNLWPTRSDRTGTSVTSTWQWHQVITHCFGSCGSRHVHFSSPLLALSKGLGRNNMWRVWSGIPGPNKPWFRNNIQTMGQNQVVQIFDNIWIRNDMEYIYIWNA